MSDMIINHMPGNVLYIENAFPKSKEFLLKLEEFENNELVRPIIPQWSFWEDGGPVRTDPNDPTKWVQFFDGSEDSHRGVSKNFDWDETLYEADPCWPRAVLDPSFSDAHSLAYEAISLIEHDYMKALDVWSKETENEIPKYITRNYCVRKYRAGGSMGKHVDKNVENPLNTMDWTALIYLNDDYKGGELSFPDLDYEISPSAGSVVFLPCLTRHGVREVQSGNKFYIFLFIHTEYGTSTALGESYHSLNGTIDRYKLLG